VGIPELKTSIDRDPEPLPLSDFRSLIAEQISRKQRSYIPAVISENALFIGRKVLQANTIVAEIFVSITKYWFCL
jgi:hypothetical protein